MLLSANIHVVVCDTESKVKSILKETANTPDLKQIIAIKPVSDEVKKQAEAIGLKIYQFKEVEVCIIIVIITISLLYLRRKKSFVSIKGLF